MLTTVGIRVLEMGIGNKMGRVGSARRLLVLVPAFRVGYKHETSQK